VPGDLPPEVSLVLYRIAQEALRNAAAHARAAEVRVVLEAREQDLILSIEDSGGGFAPADLAGGAGIGLTSMAERARLIGADFAIESTPGRGTRVAVKVRLAPASRPGA
jgi:signal transduction histidine kinase